MNTNIQTFTFKSQNVRVEYRNGEPMFCLKDVAEILEIKDAKSRNFNLNQKGVEIIPLPTKGGIQQITFINEPNLYRVIFRSRKAEAVKFQDWIFEEVIPQIRKTGGYQITPKPTRALPDGLTGEQIEAVKKLHNALTKSAPKEAQARIAITLWSAVKSKFGCSYKEVPAEQFPEVLSVMSRVAVENGVLYGEVLDREPLPAPQPALPISGNALYDLAVALRYGAWAIQMGKDVSLPLRQLGCKPAVTMWTVWAETRSRLKAAANALEALSQCADAEHAAKIRPMLPEIRNLSAV